MGVSKHASTWDWKPGVARTTNLAYAELCNSILSSQNFFFFHRQLLFPRCYSSFSFSFSRTSKVCFHMKAHNRTRSKRDCPLTKAFPMAQSSLANRSLKQIQKPPNKSLTGTLVFQQSCPPILDRWPHPRSLVLFPSSLHTRNILFLPISPPSQESQPVTTSVTDVCLGLPPVSPQSHSLAQDLLPPNTSGTLPELSFICLFTLKGTTCSQHTKAWLAVIQELFIK